MSIGCYPYQHTYLVGEQFLGTEIIFLKVRRLQHQEEETLHRMELKNSDQEEEEEEMEAHRPKKNRSRTIKEVLQKVAEWRKITIEAKVNEQ